MTVAVYVRVSTQRQAQAQTIEQQLDRLRAHLRGQGVELASEQVFRDDGYSGATLNRPGLDRLRDAVRGGEVGRRSCAPAVCCPGPGRLTATGSAPTAPAIRRASPSSPPKRPWSGSCSPP